MSVQGTIRFSVMLAVGLMVGAGCSSGSGVGQANSGPYDYEALDSYLSDAKDPTIRANRSPASSVKTVGSKSLDRSSTSRKSKRPVPRGKFPKGKVFGEWVGKIDMAASMNSAPPSGGDPETAAMAEELGRAMAEAMSDMFAMSLDLHKDYTFEGLLMVMPFEGNWKQKGDRLFLTPTKIMGFTEQEIKDMADRMAEGLESNDGMSMQMTSSDFKPMELRIAENGNALIAIDPDSSVDQELVFHRKK